MQIIESILTQNDCYKAGRKITVKGLMLHSIGTPQPDPMVFVRNWNRPGIEKCVHGFIGQGGKVYQTLPWNHRGWHAGGPANNTHIGVEMCEPKTIKYISGSNFTDSDPVASKAFVIDVYNTAVELYAYLCKQYNLNPLTQIISHAEGYRLGVASNHGDPEHLWRHYGLTMAQFRKDVAAKMGNVNTTPIPSTGTTYPVAYVGQKGTNVKILQTNLAKLGYNITIDSSYGPTTTNIVKAFQAKVGITADGQAGVQTQSYIKQEIEKINYINSVLVKYGDTGEKVRVLQTSLVTLGYLAPGQVDGSFGDITRNAVKQFQSDKGLEVDGYAGPATQERIKLELAKPVEPTPIKPTPSPDPIEPTPEPTPVPVEPTPIEPTPTPIIKEQKAKELREYLNAELDTLVRTITDRWL